MIERIQSEEEALQDELRQMGYIALQSDNGVSINLLEGDGEGVDIVNTSEELLTCIYNPGTRAYKLCYSYEGRKVHVELDYDPSELIQELRSQGYDDKFFIYLYVMFDGRLKNKKAYPKLKSMIPNFVKMILENSQEDTYEG